MRKVMMVFGTRPEAIKMCPLVLELRKSRKLETIVCVSGQHREMLKQVLDIFGVVPDYDLDIMKQGQDLYDVTSRVLLAKHAFSRSVCPGDFSAVNRQNNRRFLNRADKLAQQVVCHFVAL